MAKDPELSHLHGVRIALPFGWEDTSIFRFNAPLPQRAAGGKGRVLQPNLVLTRMPRKSAEARPESFFGEANAEALRGNKTFRVAASGSGLYLDQPMAWQDSSFEDPRTGARVFQRQVVLSSFPRHFTLLTLTGSTADVDRMSEEILLGDVRHAPPEEPAAGGQGVKARLVHTLERDAAKAKSKPKGKAKG